MAGVTRPMMMSGIEKLRNWLNRSEKVAKTRPTPMGTRWFPPILTLPRTRARTIAVRTQTRIPALARNPRLLAELFVVAVDMSGLPRDEDPRSGGASR